MRLQRRQHWRTSHPPQIQPMEGNFIMSPVLPLMHPREFLCEFPLTYGELAQQLGVTVYAVDNWMGNRANPSRQTQRQVADFAARLKENAQLRKSVLSTECDE